ncbi:hypothetical protein SDRG_00020 [Saprolegnia diclina VS20]|uniref:Mbre TPR repeat protein n=1 Tax=Saprolegnia diclina (strain VS20) TaxID=1156394 RepID=T0R5R5_SAPDV|nr:hypothetical protein SDRG_00020 [Saprolegnia diclina VS20]EQC42281.1 hypothetical protein SDRG_00020 [Saprolegnia diclina VS20]|eukprot:XP_008603704.1 hypothetical protein SDRG_00020 [Saprolegnia diclina VS20]
MRLCFKYVVPYTETSGQSLVEHVRLHTADADYVQPATWYISHAWLYTFTETLSSLELFFAAKGIQDPVVWFCVFNNNQHEAKDYPFSWWQSTFKDSLAAIGNVVMIMHPWKNPITLTRSWCVFEVYVAISVGASFDVALAPTQADSFFLDMANDDIDAFYEMLGSINSKNARATVATDKTNIDAVIAAEVGFPTLDRMVFAVLENWMQSALRARIDKSQGSLDVAKYNYALAGLLCHQCHFDAALAPCETALLLYEGTLGPSARESLETRAFLGTIYGLENKPIEVWEPILVDAIAALTDVGGRADPAVMNALYHLGLFYILHGEVEKGRVVWSEALQLFHAVLGPSHPRTLTIVYTVRQLDDTSTMDANLAAEMAIECYVGLLTVLGKDNPMTLNAMMNVGVVYAEHGKLDDALEWHMEAYTGLDRVCGLTHTHTLWALYSVGETLVALSRFSEAIANLHRVRDGTKALGMDNSLLAALASEQLGLAYFSLEEYDVAMTFYLASVRSLEVLKRLPAATMSIVRLLACYDRLDSPVALADLDAMRRFALAADMWHETREKVGCDLCDIPELYGTVYVCPVCPIGTQVACAACYAIVPQCPECQVLDLVPSLPPPRMLMTRKLRLLATEDQPALLASVEDELRAYCDTHGIDSIDLNAERLVAD